MCVCCSQGSFSPISLRQTLHKIATPWHVNIPQPQIAFVMLIMQKAPHELNDWEIAFGWKPIPTISYFSRYNLRMPFNSIRILQPQPLGCVLNNHFHDIIQLDLTIPTLHQGTLEQGKVNGLRFMSDYHTLVSFYYTLLILLQGYYPLVGWDSPKISNRKRNNKGIVFWLFTCPTKHGHNFLKQLDDGLFPKREV